MSTLQQNLEETRNCVDRLDNQVASLSKEVSELTSDVKTILLLLRTKLLEDKAETGEDSAVPSPASRDSQCSFVALSQRPRPQTDLTWPQEPRPTSPVSGIVQHSQGTGEVGFLGHLEENVHSAPPSAGLPPVSEDRVSPRCQSCDNMNLGTRSSFDSSAAAGLASDSVGLSTQSQPSFKNSWQQGLESGFNSPHIGHSHGNRGDDAAMTTVIGPEVARLKDFDESSTKSSTRGDSGIDIEKEGDQQSSAHATFMSTGL